MLYRTFHFGLRHRFASALLVASACAVVAGGAEAIAAETAATSASGTTAKVKEAATVELFEAMDQKLIDVQFIARNAEQATLVVKNAGNVPLKVQLPAAFAGVPVLAQVGGGLGGGGHPHLRVATFLVDDHGGRLETILRLRRDSERRDMAQRR